MKNLYGMPKFRKLSKLIDVLSERSTDQTMSVEIREASEQLLNLCESEFIYESRNESNK